MTRIIESAPFEGEKSWENELRPTRFEDFPGQEVTKEKLKVFVEAAKFRKEPLDHVLF
ncbi:MAG: Holliday junction branch migration DNA helicase RuvB, partial [Bdellovibrionales bacterium]